MNKIFFEGFLLQASLIFALGAQNVFVLESGLRKQHPLVVSFACFVCDLTLIMIGVIGASKIFLEFPLFKILIGVIGVVFLFHYGVSKLFFEFVSFKQAGLEKMSLKRSILLSITFSILNPHAYLDAFILIGGYSAKYPAVNDRVFLGLGAALYSGLWFVLLSFASGKVKPFLENPLRMKYAMATAGTLLIFLSGKLSLNVYEWIQESTFNTYQLGQIFNYPMPPKGIFTSILY